MILGCDAGLWYSYQFDLAVNYFGTWIEAKLKERDKRGNYINTLEDLLKDKKDKKKLVRELVAAFGVMEL